MIHIKEHLLNNRVRILRGFDALVMDAVDANSYVEQGFGVLVSFQDHDYPLITRWKGTSLRHYRFVMENYPIPNRWELEEFHVFVAYELLHDRKLLLWFNHSATEQVVLQSLVDAFARDSIQSDFTNLLKQKLSAWRYRVRHIPAKLSSCSECVDKGCFTDLVFHKTSISNAEKIIKSGQILSAVNARNMSGKQLSLEEKNESGDPPDYFDAIMFSFGNCCLGDRFVMEKIYGTPIPKKYYKNKFFHGVRFYFFHADLIAHENYVADGYHKCKIKDSLPLEPFLVAVVAPEYARKKLLSVTPQSIADRFIFLDHTKYDFLEWGHVCYTAVKEFISRSTLTNKRQ